MNAKEKIKIILGLILIFLIYFMFILMLVNEKTIVNKELLDKGRLEDNFKSIESWRVFDSLRIDGKNSTTSITLANEGYKDENSVLISGDLLNDVRIYKKIKVKPNSYYKISVMTKVDIYGNDGIGANISAIGYKETYSIKSTYNNWRKMEVYLQTQDEQNEINLSFGLGGYDKYTSGYAYFDELCIEEVDEIDEDKFLITFKKRYTKK